MEKINVKDVDLTVYSNRRGFINVNTLSIGVEIKQARVRYGHIDLLVTPINGNGEKWMEIHKVELS
jgi:hypothetical protein